MATEMRASLQNQYDRDGYLVVRGVIDAELAEEARNHVTWLLRKHPDLRPENLHTQLVAGDPFWVRLVSDDRLLDLAEQFIGPDIALFASHWLAKPPFDGKPVLWHQDGSFWPLEPMCVISLWLAADDATAENGCMRVIPGTHRLRLEEVHARTDVDNVLSAAMDEGIVDESNAVDVLLGAGDVELHHPNIVHGSNANNSPHWRRGLTIRYIPTSTRILDKTITPLLLRGKAVPGINEYAPKPRYVPGEHMPFRGSEAWAST
jgi:phytanoyl-CoA hydroxylase